MKFKKLYRANFASDVAALILKLEPTDVKIELRK